MVVTTIIMTRTAEVTIIDTPRITNEYGANSKMPLFKGPHGQQAEDNRIEISHMQVEPSFLFHEKNPVV